MTIPSGRGGGRVSPADVSGSGAWSGVAGRSRKSPASSCEARRDSTSSWISGGAEDAAINAARCVGGSLTAASKSAPTRSQRSLILVPGEFSLQPRARQCPVALDRGRRDAKGFGGFFDAKAAEIAQLDDFRLTLVEPGESI